MSYLRFGSKVRPAVDVESGCNDPTYGHRNTEPCMTPDPRMGEWMRDPSVECALSYQGLDPASGLATLPFWNGVSGPTFQWDQDPAPISPFTTLAPTSNCWIDTVNPRTGQFHIRSHEVAVASTVAGEEIQLVNYVPCGRDSPTDDWPGWPATLRVNGGETLTVTAWVVGLIQDHAPFPSSFIRFGLRGLNVDSTDVIYQNSQDGQPIPASDYTLLEWETTVPDVGAHDALVFIKPNMPMGGGGESLIDYDDFSVVVS